MDEYSGLPERRATLTVSLILVGIALFSFLHRYLPMDTSLWALQFEEVHSHWMHSMHDGVKLIVLPSANTGLPIVGAMLNFLFSGEVTARFLQCFVAILLRGLGMVALFRSLRVRDIAVYYIIPIVCWSSIWFSGALPYLVGETVGLWTLVFLFNQRYPGKNAYWAIAIGLAITALLHALAFFFIGLAILAVALRQLFSVHLSQGWLSSGRAVCGLLLPGFIISLLSIFTGEHVLLVSSSQLLPIDGLGRLFFFLTAAPNVLEATIRYGEIAHGVISLAMLVLIAGFLARAFWLPMEEVTWQSSSLKLAAIALLVLAVVSPFLVGWGVDTAAGAPLGVILILIGSYSRGPAVRRNTIDRVLLTLSLITLIAVLLLNGFSINRGSAGASTSIELASDLLRTERDVERQSAEAVRPVRTRLVLDSALAQEYSTHLVGTISFSQSALIYLCTEERALNDPAQFQPGGGLVRTNESTSLLSPVIPRDFATPTNYLDSNVHILAALETGSKTSSSFGNTELFMHEDQGTPVAIGEAKFRLSLGSLTLLRPTELAIASNFSFQ